MKNFPQDLNDWNEYRPMVRWFSPIVLLKTLEKVLPSTLFARYADRRLVHAALDSPINAETIIEECCGGAMGICLNKDSSEFWVDYVADLGDGFDSTYAIAYLIGQKDIKVKDDLKLPRAGCLVMGGDEVYPDASPDDYKKRMQRPYRAAFPRSSKPGSCHPPVYLIPGNHDWYDGLTLFLARFCRGRATPLGSWVASQRRSYFAVHLGKNWWIWGFDSQLGEDIDKPQSDYFTAVAQKMEPNAKVIICASVPTWLAASLTGSREEQERFYRGLDYVANIVRNECPFAKVPLVLSGDLHHYSRYVSKATGTNFITAGGGGAFLHPTHYLVKDTLEIKWAGSEQVLEIGRGCGNNEGKKAIYPPQDKSRRLALGNLAFFYTNWDFSLVLGLLYWVCALLMLAWSGYGGTGGTDNFSSQFWNQVNTLWPTPVFVFVNAALVMLLVKTADIKSTLRRRIVSPLHSLFHVAIVLFGTALVSTTLAFFGLQSVFRFGDILYFFALMLGMLLLGFVGGITWGIYLAVASWFWGDEPNSAFSAMRLDNYKNFIRLRIDGDTLTIYPIGIDKSPERDEWKFNEDYKDEEPDQDTPPIVPKSDLGQHLIEDPIVIEINNVSPLRLLD